MQSLRSANGPKRRTEWQAIPWRKAFRLVRNLRQRIFRASSKGEHKKVRSLQKLMLRSYSNILLSVRRVTQVNKGKNTPGVDKMVVKTPSARGQLTDQLSTFTPWQAKPARRVYIPKSNGKQRPLGIPVVIDRCLQAMVKNALEPEWEAKFEGSSYGFRPGRSCHDAIERIFKFACANKRKKWVLDADIKGAFDRIRHSAIMDRLIAPRSIKQGIFRCLKAGVNPEFPEQGTPQGGVASPLLANIALNGIEEIHRSVRYADDMVIILKLQDDADEILGKISQFLAERGMNVSEKKTKLTATTDGFDFLGWHFKVQRNGKSRCIPSTDNFKTFRQKVKHIVNNSNYGATIKAIKLAPVVRGWRNYHRFCKMDGSRFSLYHIQNRTFKVFNKEAKQNRHTSKKLLDKAFPSVPYSENKHVMVKGNKSPFDGDIAYWSERNSKLYDGKTSKALKRQNHSCGYCGLKMLSDEKVHLHHVDGNHDNWKNNNLLALHESCHDYIHMSKSES